MPIAEYQCPKGHTSDYIVAKMEDAKDEARCIICGVTAKKVEVSKSSFRLMPGGAGGFYKSSSS